MIVALLNRWASLQHVAPGLARLCGWLPVERRPAVDHSGDYFGKAWDDLAMSAFEWKDAEPIVAASELGPWPAVPIAATMEDATTCAIVLGGYIAEVPDGE